MRQAPLASFGFSFFFQLQNIFAHTTETILGCIAKQRIPVTIYGRSDIAPVYWFECLKRCGKELLVFHHHMSPLMYNELANNSVNILTKTLSIREDEVNRFSNFA